MMNDDKLNIVLNQVQTPAPHPDLQSRIEAQAFERAQHQKLSFGLPFIFRDWRWVAVEALSACAMLAVGFYLGLSSADDVFNTPVITAFETITVEEDWTL